MERDLKKINAEKNMPTVNEAAMRKKCLAEISLPCKTAADKTVDLKVNITEIRDILQHI